MKRRDEKRRDATRRSWDRSLLPKLLGG